MTRQERAKQFMPFDAMKGLKEALVIREERHNRVEKRELSEDTIEYISSILGRVEIIKRHRLTDWLHKQDPTFCCLQETHLTENMSLLYHRARGMGRKDFIIDFVRLHFPHSFIARF